MTRNLQIWIIRTLEIFIIAVLIGLSVPLIDLFNKRLERKMNSLKTQAVRLMEEKLGRKISYESISPSIFGFLAVKNLRIHSFAEPGTVLLQINRVKIYYNIFDLILTKDPIHSFREVSISNSLFNINRERDREIFESLKRITAAGNIGQGRASPGLSLSGTNITIQYSFLNREVKLSKLFFKILSRKDFYLLTVRTTVQYDHAPAAGENFQAVARIRVNGKVDRRLAWSDLAVRIYSLRTANLEIGRQNFQVTHKENEFSVRKIQDRAPLDLHFLLNLDSRELTAKFKTENFIPSGTFQLTGDLKGYNRFLKSSLSSSGSFTYKIDESTVSYMLDLQTRVEDKQLPLELNIVSHLFGNERILYLEPLIVHSERGTIEFFGNILIENYFPAGFLQLIDIRSIMGQNLNATFQVQRESQGLAVRGSRLFIGAASFEAFDLEIFPKAGEVDFSLSAALAEAGDNSLKAEGKLSLKPKALLSIAAQMSNIPLNTLYQLLTPADYYSWEVEQRLRPLNLSLSLETETDFSRFDLFLPNVRITDLHNSANNISFSFKGDKNGLDVENLIVNWHDYELSGQFQSAVTRQSTQFNASLKLEELPYEFSGFYIPGSGVQIDGSYDFHAYWQFSGLGSPAFNPESYAPLWGSPFELNLSSFPIPFKQGTLKISTNIKGIRTNRGELYAVSGRTELADIPFITPQDNSLLISFNLNRDVLYLTRIAYRDLLSELTGQGKLNFNSLSPVAGTGQITLASESSPERYSISAGLVGGELEADFIFKGAPLSRLGNLIITGDATGRVAVRGRTSQPEIAVDFALNEGRLNVDPLSLEFSANYAENLLRLNSLDVTYLVHKITYGRGWLSADSGKFLFTSGYRSEYFGDPVDLTVTLEGKIKVPDKLAPVQSLFSSELQGALRLSNIMVQQNSYPDWVFALESSEGKLYIDGGPDNAIHGQFLESGGFTLSLLPPLPIQGTASGSIDGDRFESSFIVTQMDMKIINSLFRTEFLRFTRGVARGNLRIAGLINDPDFYGILQVSDSGLTIKLSPNEVAPINGRLVFNEKSFTMERLSSNSGRATVTAEGVFYLDHWTPVAYELLFRSDNDPGIWIRHNFGPIFADGFTRGILRVQGDQNVIRIDGDLFINSCRIAVEKRERDESGGIPLSVNMSFRTGRRVEFYWPSIKFPIIRTYAKQGEQVSLSIDEETGDFKMWGDVDIRGGEIFYFGRSFYLKEGSITFGEDIGEFDPRIRALAEIRERDQNNQEVKIVLETDDRLSEFSPRFYSEPNLPDLEIMDYIGGSIFNQIEESGFGVSAVLLTSDVVGHFRILSPFERAVRELLGLDLFSIRTQFVQNVLIGRLLGENFPSNVINPLDNTTLSLGKYLGADLFLEIVVRFQSVDVASAEYAAVSQIRPEGEINFEWTTPFFLLEWSFCPQHPEDLFLTDNTIGLQWRFSY